MSEEPDQDDARIRALLAELGSGPDGRAMPPEVAARLDDTLARLVAERETEAASEGHHEGRHGTVVPLRRRWQQRATVAAAAVIVAGAGGVAAANLGVFGPGASVSSDSAGTADPERAESAPEPTTSAPESTPGSKALTDEDSARDSGLDVLALPQVRSSAFASDVSALLQRRTAVGGADEAPTPKSSQGLTTPEQARQTPGPAARSDACPGPATTDGATANLVLYDGRLAVLVIHPEQADRRLVEVWTCGGDSRLAGTTITP